MSEIETHVETVKFSFIFYPFFTWKFNKLLLLHYILYNVGTIIYLKQVATIHTHTKHKELQQQHHSREFIQESFFSL